MHYSCSGSKMVKSYVLVGLVLTLAVNELDASEETMRGITSSFLKVLDECKRELDLGDHILTDLYNFWKKNALLVHRDTGCAIVCMSKKLDLLDPSGNLHHGNAQEFAVKNGAAEDVAARLVSLVHECERRAAAADGCERALDLARCVRDTLRELSWAPSVEVVVSEVLTEI